MAEAMKTTFRSVTGETLEKSLWEAQGEPKGIVQLVHGMAEHIHRYDWMAKELNQAGYTVVGHTHLGHGPLAEIKGYFAPTGGWDAVLADTHTLRRDTQTDFPKLPHFLLGHSMGSFVVRCYQLLHGDDLQGIIISGTGHFDKPILTAGSLVAGLQCLFGGAKKPSKLLHTMNFAANNKAIDHPQTDSDWLSRDSQQVEQYRNDPLCGFPFTAKAYGDMFDGLKRLYPDKLGGIPKDVPVYFFSGENDPVGSMGEGVKKVFEEQKAAGVKDISLKLYPGGRHEMLNEINKEEVVQDLILWLNAHLPSK